MYNEFVIQSSLSSSYNFFYKLVDRGIIEKVGPYGLVAMFQNLITTFRNNQTGSLINPLKVWFFFIVSISIFLTSVLSTVPIFEEIQEENVLSDSQISEIIDICILEFADKVLEICHDDRIQMSLEQEYLEQKYFELKEEKDLRRIAEDSK